MFWAVYINLTMNICAVLSSPLVNAGNVSSLTFKSTNFSHHLKQGDMLMVTLMKTYGFYQGE